MTGMLALLWLASAEAAVKVEPPPEPGVATRVWVTDEADQPVIGAVVRVVHRPELATRREIAIGTTDARGRVEWTPEESGTTMVRVDREEVRVHVPWSSPPAVSTTLLALLGAGGLGAMIVGLVPNRRRVRRRKRRG